MELQGQVVFSWSLLTYSLKFLIEASKLTFMKEIPLTQNKTAFIDDSDYELIASHKWRIEKVNKTYGNTYYACRTTPKSSNNKRGFEYMHWLIMGKPKKGFETDHIDGNGLNNRRSNLRIVTTAQNSMNAKKAANKSSVYKGVSFHKRMNKWIAYIRINKKLKTLGYFSSEISAAMEYNKYAKELFGQFANLNVFE